jgi:hypothetical protein
MVARCWYCYLARSDCEGGGYSRSSTIGQPACSLARRAFHLHHRAAANQRRLFEEKIRVLCTCNTLRPLVAGINNMLWNPVDSSSVVWRQQVVRGAD